MRGGTVFSEFLDDYFAECDEHLAVMRRALITLSGMVGRVLEDPTPLEELRRRLHTVKGLSGMVQFQEAQDIAHVLEDCVKATLRYDAPLAEAGVVFLRDGLARLEAALTARRDGMDPHDPTPFVRDAQDRCREFQPSAGGGEPADASVRMRRWTSAELKRLRERRQAAEKLWCFSFEPSPDRNRRGIDVNAVRERLNGLGTLLKAIPRVLPGGGIAFDFYVATAKEPDAWNSWAEDGLTWNECLELTETMDSESGVGRGQAGAERPEAPLRSSVVRVDVQRLDELYRCVGMLFTLVHRLQDHVKQCGPDLDKGFARALGDMTQEMGRELRTLRDRITAMRMMPVGDVFDRLQLAALNLAKELGKSIRVHIEGARTEIDKFVAERMLDPLLHVVRNAVSHGIEPAQERAAAGKDPVGTVFIAGRSLGDHIEILIGDDGRGIDEEAVRRVAGSVGPEPHETFGGDTSADLLTLLCRPGFSTRTEADRASGRGLGLSIVRETAASLGGRLTLHNMPGKGCSFVVRLPLTLVVQSLFVVRAGPVNFGLPVAGVREVLHAESERFSHVPGMRVMPYAKGALPLLDLRAWAGFGAMAHMGTVPVLVVEGQGRMVGIMAERVLGLRDMVVHGITETLLHLPGVMGAADLGDGHVVFVLDPDGVTAHWLNTVRRNS